MKWLGQCPTCGEAIYSGGKVTSTADGKLYHPECAPRRLTKSERRALAALERGPLYRGAVRLVLEGKVVAPGKTLRRLEVAGLARCGRTNWEITDAGREWLKTYRTQATPNKESNA